MVDWRLPLDLEPGPHLRLDSRVDGGFDPNRPGLEQGQLQVLDRFPGPLDRVQRGLFAGDRTPRGDNAPFVNGNGHLRYLPARVKRSPGLDGTMFTRQACTQAGMPHVTTPRAIATVTDRPVQRRLAWSSSAYPYGGSTTDATRRRDGLTCLCGFEAHADCTASDPSIGRHASDGPRRLPRPGPSSGPTVAGRRRTVATAQRGAQRPHGTAG